MPVLTPTLTRLLPPRMVLAGRKRPAEMPLDMGGCVLWLAADRLAGVSDGASVALWPDLSGKGNHAGQATLANRPTFKTSVLNRLPVIRFDGTSSYLDQTWAQGLMSPTIMYVINRRTNPATDDGVITFVKAGSSDWNNANALSINDGPAGTVIQEQQNGGGGSTSAIGLSVFNVVTVVSTAGIFINGVSRIVTGAFSITPDRLVIGARLVPTVTKWTPSDIAELMIFNRRLTTVEQKLLEGYLGTKYAIAVS